MNLALCIRCKYFELEGMESSCMQEIWPRVSISKSRIYNPHMFECIDYARESEQYLYYTNTSIPQTH